VRYFRGAVGSLLEALSARERARVVVVLFVVQTEPALHPEFGTRWMQAMAGRVLVYNVLEAKMAELTR
jgi:hypothetical protein